MAKMPLMGVGPRLSRSGGELASGAGCQDAPFLGHVPLPSDCLLLTIWLIAASLEFGIDKYIHVCCTKHLLCIN